MRDRISPYDVRQDVQSFETARRMPRVCVKCGAAGDVNLQDYVFSFKSAAGAVGSAVASVANVGPLSANLSYDLQHKARLWFCRKCYAKSKGGEGRGVLWTLAFFAFAFLLGSIGILIDDLLPVLFVSAFVCMIVGVFVRYFVSKKAALEPVRINRTEVVLDVPAYGRVRIHFPQASVKLDIG